MHARFPDAERQELADRFCSYGADPDTAVRMAAAVSEDAVNPNELPSPLLAGGASLVAFSLGAILPLLPYLLACAPWLSRWR